MSIGISPTYNSYVAHQPTKNITRVAPESDTPRRWINYIPKCKYTGRPAMEIDLVEDMGYTRKYLITSKIKRVEREDGRWDIVEIEGEYHKWEIIVPPCEMERNNGAPFSDVTYIGDNRWLVARRSSSSEVSNVIIDESLLIAYKENAAKEAVINMSSAEIARKMLNLGVAIDIIIKSTGLDEESIWNL